MVRPRRCISPARDATTVAASVAPHPTAALAIRLVDAAGPGRHRDLLFASVGKGVLGRVLVPSVDFGRTRFSSILRFRWRGSPVLLTATVRPQNLTLSELRAGTGAEVRVSATRSDGTVTLLEVTTAEIGDGRGVGMWAPPPDDVLIPVGFLNALARAGVRSESGGVRGDRSPRHGRTARPR